MKLFSNQDPVDKLTHRLIKDFTATKAYEVAEADKDVFLVKVQQRIKLQRNLAQVWEFGVFSARNWLFALCCIAVLFFFGNLFVIGSSPRSHQSIQFVSGDVSEVEDTDYIHATSSDEIGEDIIFRKE